MTCPKLQCPRTLQPGMGEACDYWDDREEICIYVRPPAPTEPETSPKSVNQRGAAVEASEARGRPRDSGQVRQGLPPLAELSRARFEAGIAHGLPSQPWADPDRDFVQETAEELADAAHYLEWAVLQGKGSDSDRIRLVIALDYVASAYSKLRPVSDGGTSAAPSGRQVTPGEAGK